MANEARKRGTSGRRLDKAIVDTALAMAEDGGWANLRLRLVAERLDVPLDRVSRHYRDLDAVADAWFGRAMEAMLVPLGRNFARLPARQRLCRRMLLWFDAQADHRRVSGEMLKTKLYLSHVHHWAPMAFNLSRVVHWLRDAAGLDAVGRRRQVEEIGLTLLFLATLAVWLGDETPGQERTRSFLERRLAEADRGMARIFSGHYPSSDPEH